MNNADHLCSARAHADQCAESLRKALPEATMLEAIILFPLIERATVLRREIAALLNAVQS